MLSGVSSCPLNCVFHSLTLNGREKNLVFSITSRLPELLSITVDKGALENKLLISRGGGRPVCTILNVFYEVIVSYVGSIPT